MTTGLALNQNRDKERYRVLGPPMLLLWDNPVWSALASGTIYLLIAAAIGSLWRTSANAYYNYLADAFLHGQLQLRMLPSSLHDLSLFHGQYYLYWPPLPAFLFMPFVAVFGVEFPDTAFNIGIGAANVGMVAVLLRYAALRGVVRLSRTQRAWLVLFFALGTVHLTLAPLGRVWYTGQLVAFFCVMLAYLAVLMQSDARAFLYCGLALAGAMLTRNHLVLAGLWPAAYLLYRHWSIARARLLRYCGLWLLPLVTCLAALGLYNWLRFGNALDNGLAYHKMAELFVVDFQKYGAFSLHYLPTNLYYQFLAYPFPLRASTFFGGSLFLLSPVFCGAFCAFRAGRPVREALLLTATVLLVEAPILLLMGTGWVEFGSRYTLDFIVPLLLLTGIGIRTWPTRRLGLLVYASVLQYSVGTMLLGKALSGG